MIFHILNFFTSVFNVKIEGGKGKIIIFCRWKVSIKLPTMKHFAESLLLPATYDFDCLYLGNYT